MSNNNVIMERKKALLAYKEKILDQIKDAEKSVDEFRANHKKKTFYDDFESSDLEDYLIDLTSADQGPSISELKIQQAMKKTCLHATQELIGLIVLQSEVDVLVEEPKFEGEGPVTEAGTWREVTAECRIDLVPFTMTFFMHTPHRKFGPPSYRGLRVAPVKGSHELELSNSVLHTLKTPSDAVEVIRSYAAGYRSRRTTLLRLANKYTNLLFMEPHAEGGFVLKCADLMEVSWKLENKWSPVAPFYHKMEFTLEFMEESYVKIISQAHKELVDPSIQTDERTLLLAKIITTCLEARGPVDPESDLESKTTERDNDIDRIESESERRDSEVMAPPKSLPKKGKQKKSSSLPNTAEKRKIDDENDDSGPKKMKNDASEAKRNTIDNNNPRKSKMNDVANEGAKKRKISEVNKVASAKNAKDTGNIEDGNTKSKETHVEDNAKAKNVRESDKITKPKNLKGNEDNNANTNPKPKNTKESVTNAENNTNNKVSQKAGETGTKEINPKLKTKVLKEPAKIDSKSKPKTKTNKETVQNQENDIIKDKNTVDSVQNKENVTKNAVKIPSNTEKIKNNVNKVKNATTKDTGNAVEKNQDENINKNKKISKVVSNTKSKENVDANTDAGRPKNTNIDKNVAKNDNKTKNTDATKVKNVTSSKNDEQTTKKAPEKSSNVANTKNVEKTTKKAPVQVSNVATSKNDEQTAKKAPEKRSNFANSKNHDQATKTAPEKVSNVAISKNDGQTTKKAPEKSSNVANTKNDEKTTKKAPEKTANVASTKTNDQNKKVVEKNVKNKEKIPDIANKVSQKNVNEKTVQNKAKNDAQTVKKVTEKNATNVRIKDKISQISTKVSDKIVKDKPAMKDVQEKALNSNLNTKTKNTIKKPITKIASHRHSLKPLNPPKVLKPGNTKTLTTGNIEKENGGKGSKIPQKTISTISEGSSKKNFLRMSPRNIPSKFKTQPQETLKQKIMKYTNIPRLLKKPAPTTT